jgi:predicted translin family RNA/ssDNA-binding protein
MIDDGDVVSMRRERLLEAIRRLEEMNGSPDLLESCQRALQELTEAL